MTTPDVTPPSFAPSRDVALQVDGLTVEFATDRGWTRVVDGVSFSVLRGETLAIVGESGSGKSVTSLACMGLLPRRSSRTPSGTAELDGVDLLSLPVRAMEDLRGDRIAMAFQEPMTSLNPAYTVGDQIAEVVRRHRDAARKEGWRRAVEVLDLVGIPRAAERVKSYPHEFSGGMRQRVMIAMAIACEPAVLIADELTTALDVTIQAQVLDVVRQMRDQLGMAVLFITHDLAVVADIADRVLVMYAGQEVETSAVDDLFARPAHPYTEGLLRSMPQSSTATAATATAVGTGRRRLDSIPGQPPVPGSMPAGCRFAPRCPYAVEACVDGVPELLQVRPEHFARCTRALELTLRGTR
ncbi:MAG: ATP-binding cassette domain-containing protein [Pseudonocardiaceae bacterium]|nr:ATP-binding cassette domain-containing protein [Pseudonocardiaceae bacterium]